MVLSNSNANVLKFTLIPQWTYFLLVRKIRLFSHEKVVITQSDACCWFYAPIYADWLPLRYPKNVFSYWVKKFENFQRCIYSLLVGDRRDGGVSIYIHYSLKFKERSDLSINNKDIESLTLEILSDKTHNV